MKHAKMSFWWEMFILNSPVTGIKWIGIVSKFKILIVVHSILLTEIAEHATGVLDHNNNGQFNQQPGKHILRSKNFQS